ncbi:MAG: hypothetical protein U1C51_07325 [Candidatus Izemoplasmatales bacterium]|nr:hypothetical protein [Candidatus Izemoplasmatales bacterium]
MNRYILDEKTLKSLMDIAMTNAYGVVHTENVNAQHKKIINTILKEQKWIQSIMNGQVYHEPV